MQQTKQARILIVDDENLVLKAYSKELMDAGYYVSTAKNAKEALEQIEKGKYDIVYVDLVMPEVNGIELCKLVKARLPKTEVILISANPGEILKFQKAFWEAGGRDEILRKPLAEGELLDVTTVVLREMRNRPSEENHG